MVHQIDEEVRAVMSKVDRRIRDGDAMCSGNEAHYFSVGASALTAVLLALESAGTGAPRRVLDFGCGHGRVMRAMRAVFPGAELLACDVDVPGVAHCVETFGARAVAGSVDLDRVEAVEAVDLIWCGSVLTHLAAPQWPRLLGYFARALSADAFAPAYGEDVDLALRLRARGLEVLYQPRSEVTHLEGVTAGTSTRTGVKAHQVANLERLFERWRIPLRAHRPEVQEPEREKDRGVDRRVLFVDLFTPRPDQAAGKRWSGWREELPCPITGLNNRRRATTAFAEQLLLSRDHVVEDVYLTEQVTPFYKWMSARFCTARVTGSEYFGPGVPSGEVRDGIRHEDIERRGLATASLDLIVRGDVLEHVNEPQAAFSEPARVPRPGGHLLFTVPFTWHAQQNRRRSRVVNGEIEHYVPPSYHGNPMDPKGSLAFFDYGWALLDWVRKAGFREVSVISYWSETLGHLGGMLEAFHARR